MRGASPLLKHEVQLQLAEAAERGEAGAGAPRVAWSGAGDADKCTLQELGAGVEYVIRVRAGSVEGDGAWSVPLCASTVAGPPATPAAPVVVAKTSTTMLLRWGGDNLAAVAHVTQVTDRNPSPSPSPSPSPPPSPSPSP